MGIKPDSDAKPIPPPPSQTGWGLVNAVTEYADHHKRARSQGNRLDNAWFGDAANIKNAVFHEALELAA